MGSQEVDQAHDKDSRLMLAVAKNFEKVQQNINFLMGITIGSYFTPQNQFETLLYGNSTLTSATPLQ